MSCSFRIVSLTKKEKKEAKEFRDAIKNNKIDEWFNKNKPKDLDK